MRWSRKTPLVLIAFLVFMLICPAKSEVYQVTSSSQHWDSEPDAYINFDDSILPLNFTTLYRDSSQRVHFNNTWIKTNVNLTLTSWFTSDWLNYTATGGTQQFYVTKPEEVYFNDVKQTEGDTWSYSGYILTVTPSGTDVGVTWEAGNGNGSESEYENPTVTSDTVWYMRSDTHTVNTVLGYVLNETATTTENSTSDTLVGNVTVFYGWRVWKVNSKGQETELTSTYVYSWRVKDGQGIQNVLWTPPTTSLHIGFDAIKAVLYLKFGAAGPWLPKATFISAQLLKKTLLATEWAFQTYTKKSFSGGSTTGTVYWGDSSHETSIAGIEFTDPDVYETMKHKIEDGDFVGFILYPYLNLVGNLFYGLVMLMVCVPVYNRYKSFTPILLMFIIFGGVVGIFSLLVPEAGLGIAWIFLLVGLGGLLYKVFR